MHKSIHYICKTACDLLAESDKFPEDWLFKHRWGKGKKDASKTLPNGEKIMFLTVGGRTSAVIPSVQKKTGPVAKEMSEAEGGDEDVKPKKGAKGKVKKEEAADGDVEPATSGKKRKIKDVEQEDEDEEVEEPATKRKPASGTKKSTKPAIKAEEPDNVNASGRRRSGRHQKA